MPLGQLIEIVPSGPEDPSGRDQFSLGSAPGCAIAGHTGETRLKQVALYRHVGVRGALLKGNVFIDTQPHDHLARTATGHATKPILHRDDARFSTHCPRLRFYALRRSAQRSDPENISGTTVGGHGACGHEISNTDLLSCSVLHDARRP